MEVILWTESVRASSKPYTSNTLGDPPRLAFWPRNQKGKEREGHKEGLGPYMEPSKTRGSNYLALRAPFLVGFKGKPTKHHHFEWVPLKKTHPSRFPQPPRRGRSQVDPGSCPEEALGLLGRPGFGWSRFE